MESKDAIELKPAAADTTPITDGGPSQEKGIAAGESEPDTSNDADKEDSTFIKDEAELRSKILQQRKEYLERQEQEQSQTVAATTKTATGASSSSSDVVNTNNGSSGSMRKTNKNDDNGNVEEREADSIASAALKLSLTDSVKSDNEETPKLSSKSKRNSRAASSSGTRRKKISSSVVTSPTPETPKPSFSKLLIGTNGSNSFKEAKIPTVSTLTVDLPSDIKKHTLRRQVRSSSPLTVSLSGILMQDAPWKKPIIEKIDLSNFAEVPPPEIHPTTTEFENEVKVSLSCGVPEARIYYTVDGTTPNKNSIKYDIRGPFILNQPVTTVKARAYISRTLESKIAQKTYMLRKSS